ncbi:glycoside hydrolase family 127 protein [Atractiella rhizophila]|nr:glycoside hydrolase family 127 protein [Atractiella rhizophila]
MSSGSSSVPVPFTQVTIRSNFWSPKVLAIETQTLPAIYKQLVETGRWDQSTWKPGRNRMDKKPHHFWDSDIAKWIEAVCYSLARPKPKRGPSTIKSKTVSHAQSSSSSVASNSNSDNQKGNALFNALAGLGAIGGSYLWPGKTDAWQKIGPVELERLVEEAIGKLESAQTKDGYLNTFYTVVEPGKRWTDTMEMHEMYCCGHLLEASLAHYTHTSSPRFLNTMLKYVDLTYKTFGPKEEGKKPAYPGHQEIELALMRLYDTLGRKEDLALVDFFIRERGKKDENGEIFWDRETRARGGVPAQKQAWRPKDPYAYNQAQSTIWEMEQVEGHSVRVVYWLTGAVHLARAQGDEELLAATRRLWDNMVGKKMYVTGGIGAIGQWEGFGPNHYLPNETGYLETCAAIGLVFLAHQFTLTFPYETRYADVLELALLNAVLVGMSLDGKSFFYENPLANIQGDYARSDWFDCSCCPPNVARLLTSLGKYIYSVGPLPSNSDDFVEVGEELIFVHLYVASTAEVELSGGDVTIVQEDCDWPWSGKVVFRIEATQHLRKKVRLALRIPEWADRFDLTDSNGRPLPLPTNSPTLIITPSEYFATSATLTLRINMPPRLIHPHYLDECNANSVCFARGPLIYAAEAIDNNNVDLRSIRIPDNPKIVEYRDVKAFAGVEGLTSPFEPVSMRVSCVQLVPETPLVGRDGEDEMEEEEEMEQEEPDRRIGGGVVWKECELKLVPYFSILNRGKNPYRVWFPRFK